MKPTDKGLDSFARRLEAFGARSVSLDRDALLFAAGQASVQPLKENTLPIRRVHAWQASTVAMTLLSFALASMLLWRPTAVPQIVYVDREVPVVKQNFTIPTASPLLIETRDVVGAPAPQINVQDLQLAEAWKARQNALALSGQSERQLAGSSGIDGRGQIEPPLTRSSLLGERSQETMQRWLREQL